MISNKLIVMYCGFYNLIIASSLDSVLSYQTEEYNWNGTQIWCEHFTKQIV